MLYFDSIVGQEHAKVRLEFCADVYEKTGICPNILLFGQNGCDATYLARALAAELHHRAQLRGYTAKYFVEINCTSIPEPEDWIKEFIKALQSRAHVTYLLDQIHALPLKISNWLLTAFDPNTTAKTVRFGHEEAVLDFKAHTIIATTTERQRDFAPLLGRFTQIELVGKEAAETRNELQPLNAAALVETLHRLDRMIGLENVKAQIRRLTDLVAMQRKRSAAGLKSAEVSLHLVFTGNPGTGKTTIARYVGEIYAALGLLAKGHLVEAHREDLVAGYIGQTAIKTKAKIQEALDGVLFIDEAYSLNVAHTSNEDFGKEAVSTLIAEMENNRDRIAVIVAGYTEEMKDFINMNPGLSSRFTRYIEFEDYAPQELAQIFIKLAGDNDYKLQEEANSALLAHLTAAHAKKGRGFGNGRFVRRIFEEAVEKHATRIEMSSLQDRDSLTTLTEADLPI